MPKNHSEINDTSQQAFHDAITPETPSEWWERTLEGFGEVKIANPTSFKTAWDDPRWKQPIPQTKRPGPMPAKEPWDYSNVPTGEEAVRIGGGDVHKFRRQERVKKIGRFMRGLFQRSEQASVAASAPCQSVVETPSVEPLEMPQAEPEQTVNLAVLDTTHIPDVQPHTYEEASLDDNTDSEAEESEPMPQNNKETTDKKPRRWRTRAGALVLAVTATLGVLSNGGDDRESNPANSSRSTATATSQAEHGGVLTPLDMLKPSTATTGLVAPEAWPSTTPQQAAPEVSKTVTAQPEAVLSPELFSKSSLTPEGTKAFRDYYRGYEIKPGDTKWGLAQNFLASQGESVTRAKTNALVQAWSSQHMTQDRADGWLMAGDRVL